MAMTEQEKIDRRETRKLERRRNKRLAEIQEEMNQKPVKELTITIEWKKSRTWGMNPHAEAQVVYCDGYHDRVGGFTASGCGYDKESTVIAQIFNAFLKYKLYEKRKPTKTYNGEERHPYGCYYYGGAYKDNGTYFETPCYNGGVGTGCYYSIGEFVGGKFEKIASGKTFDVFKYTDGQIGGTK